MHPKAMSETDKYKSRGRPGVGGTKTRGESKKFLNLLKSMLAIIIPNRRLVLPQKTKDRLAYVCQSSNETTDIL